MKVGNFELKIPEGIEKNAQVFLKENQEFTLYLRNGMGARAEAKLTMNGVYIETFILKPYYSGYILVNPNTQKCFKAVKAGTPDGNAAGITYGDEKNGLITVEFTPERKVESYVERSAYKGFDESLNSKSFSGSRSYGAGGQSCSQAGIGEGSDSYQEFDRVKGITSYDFENAAVINLRIVIQDKPSTTTPLVGKKPLSNPIPPLQP